MVSEERIFQKVLQPVLDLQVTLLCAPEVGKLEGTAPPCEPIYTTTTTTTENFEALWVLPFALISQKHLAMIRKSCDPRFS